LPAGRPCGGGGETAGGPLPGTRTGVGCTGPMALLEKAAREATDNMRLIIGRIG
jgi:hypothetical protein